MMRKYVGLAVAFVAAIFVSHDARAAIVINSQGTHSLDLTGYNGALANLPTGVTGAFVSGTDGGVRERGFTQTGTSLVNMGAENPPNYNGSITSGGFYAWGTIGGTTIADITASTLAFQSTGGSASMSNTVTYQNGLANAIQSLTFSFDAYQWRRSTGTRLSEIVLSSSIAGFDPFTFAGTGGAAAAAGRTFGTAAPTGFAADQFYTSTVTGLNILPGETFSFTFTMNRDGAVVGSGSAQGLAVGNIQLGVTAVPEPSSMAILSLIGGVGAYRARRRFTKKTVELSA